MKYLSVCAGIEAASAAWHPLGWEPVAFAEIEPFPCAVLAHHYPSVPNWGDMTKFKDWPNACLCRELGHAKQKKEGTRSSLEADRGRDSDSNVNGWNGDNARRSPGSTGFPSIGVCNECGGAALDLLVGGTPCQSFSVAGLRKGLADPRGNLALTYLAIADRYRPEWLVWENVPGVLSSGQGRDFGAFLGGLGQLGYGWAYRVLDAQYFGLAQRRKRVFVVASLRGWQRAAAVLFDSASLRGDSAPRREAGQRLADTLTVGANQCSGRPCDFVEAIANTLGGASQSGGFRTTDLDNQGAFIPEVVGALSDGAHMGGGLNGQDAYTGRIFAVPSESVDGPHGQGDQHDVRRRADADPSRRFL